MPLPFFGFDKWEGTGQPDEQCFYNVVMSRRTESVEILRKTVFVSHTWCTCRNKKLAKELWTLPAVQTQVLSLDEKGLLSLLQGTGYWADSRCVR